MTVGGLTLDPVTKTPIVILRDPDNKLNLPIWIGLLEATSMATELEGIKMARPMTHDLLRTILDELGATVEWVEVTELRENTYFALIYLRVGDRQLADRLAPVRRHQPGAAHQEPDLRRQGRARSVERPAADGRAARSRTSPTSRATSGPRSSRRCRPTTSSTRCSGMAPPRNASSSTARRCASPTSSRPSPGRSRPGRRRNTHDARRASPPRCSPSARSSAASAGIARRRAAAAAARSRPPTSTSRPATSAEAADAFAALGRDYAGTPYGRLAALYEGHALARKPDPAAAAAAYSRLPGELAGDRVPASGSARRASAQAREAGGDAKGAQRSLRAGRRDRRPVPDRCSRRGRASLRSRGPARQGARGLSRDPEGLAQPARSGRCWKRRYPADVAAASAEAH